MIPRLGVRHRQNNEHICLGRVCDKALGTVEDIVVTLQHSCCLLARGVGASPRLRQSEGTDLAASQ